jgi:hypothetical protein
LVAIRLAGTKSQNRNWFIADRKMRQMKLPALVAAARAPRPSRTNKTSRMKKAGGLSTAGSLDS